MLKCWGVEVGVVKVDGGRLRGFHRNGAEDAKGRKEFVPSYIIRVPLTFRRKAPQVLEACAFNFYYTLRVLCVFAVKTSEYTLSIYTAPTPTLQHLNTSTLKKAINPVLSLNASSSILKVGVCRPEVMDLERLHVPVM